MKILEIIELFIYFFLKGCHEGISPLLLLIKNRGIVRGPVNGSAQKSKRSCLETKMKLSGTKRVNKRLHDRSFVIENCHSPALNLILTAI